MDSEWSVEFDVVVGIYQASASCNLLLQLW